MLKVALFLSLILGLGFNTHAEPQPQRNLPPETIASSFIMEFILNVDLEDTFHRSNEVNKPMDKERKCKLVHNALAGFGILKDKSFNEIAKLIDVDHSEPEDQLIKAEDLRSVLETLKKIESSCFVGYQM